MSLPFLSPRQPRFPTPPCSLLRQAFHLDSDTPEPAAAARRVLQLLLAQDGATTRLCETVAGGPVELWVYEQRTVDTVPGEVRAVLPGTRFIERITCLAAHGQVLMDNLTYIALDGLAPDLQRDLEAATLPIGHLLARLWVRRAALATSLSPTAAPALAQRLWDVVGVPDAPASRSYSIVTPDGPIMLIAETYRRGMLMTPHGAPHA